LQSAIYSPNSKRITFALVGGAQLGIDVVENFEGRARKSVNRMLIFVVKEEPDRAVQLPLRRFYLS
jgi:hypothetical protein